LIFTDEEWYRYYESKKAKQNHRSTFCSIFNVSSCRKPKYKMICLKSPKSSEFAIKKTVVKNP